MATGSVLSPLLYSLYTNDCAARHNSNTIVKFADNTVVVGGKKISDFCPQRRRSYTPLLIDGTPVERGKLTAPSDDRVQLSRATLCRDEEPPQQTRCVSARSVHLMQGRS
ncbi:hypothetical protein F2P81_016522 [Scophthalmus maximus]|uniref:Reverse transcriptase domain-containing protein n=1 Tax=Scophthalmus maximus TaxID=52904 RepID=A0A6A4SFE5_SCOMX|nr:hypothetical protein F2P81_016522 [Scophthalmus maximus]